MSEGLEIRDGRADLASAVAELAERLPAELKPLARLAYNYAWSWLPGGREVFATLDAEYWRRTNCNPRRTLEFLSPRRLRELATDGALIQRVGRLGEHFLAMIVLAQDMLRAAIERSGRPELGVVALALAAHR